MKVPLYKQRQHRSSRNWLVHRVHDEALEDRVARYARGIVLDVGCGGKPYAPLLAGHVDWHIGLDHPASGHETGQVDLFALAYDTALADESVDTVLCTFVLEHLEDPLRALQEIRRVLRPGGHLILSAPQSWHLHEAPRDFYRYTGYGLQYLLETSGLESLEVTPLSGFVVTFFQEASYVVRPAARGLGAIPRALAAAMFQRLGWWLHRWDRSTGYTWANMAVARKP